MVAIMFQKGFQPITTSNSDNTKEIYNQGVLNLARNNIQEAISLFEKISTTHSSAAYNLGLIYLDGVGKFTPNYKLARHYLTMAHKLGHQKAATSAQIIGLNSEKKLSKAEQSTLFQFAVMQYVLGKQLGNLAYLIAYDIKHNILETSSNELYSLDRFISYELYCIRNYGNQEVKELYETSSLTNREINYMDDWVYGETAVISDYLNNQVWVNIIGLSDGKIKFYELGTLRLAIVNAVYESYL